MRQSLFKAICPDCGNKVKNIIKWVDIVDRKAIPDNLPEESCPECTLDKTNKILFAPKQPRLL